MPRHRIKGAAILELLKDGAITTVELFLNSSLEPFRHSYKGGPAPLRGVDISIREILNTVNKDRKDWHRFRDLLINLKRDGLVVKDLINDQEGWVISKKGMAELASFKKQPEQRYKKSDSDEVIVISYDIPEKFRSNRNWLRSVLKMLDFKILHQSVWIGKTVIPETLLADLRERKIDSFIHIFTIGKEGSLVQVL